MTEFLETTVDKFTFKVATDRLYNAEGVWAKAEGDLLRIGLSDFLQQHSGDVPGPLTVAVVWPRVEVSAWKPTAGSPRTASWMVNGRVVSSSSVTLKERGL